MIKKIIWSMASCLMAFLFLSGCGMPHEQYDAVVAEREAAQAEAEARVAEIEEKFTALEGSQVGDLSLRFELKDLDGKTVTLYELWGSPMMLNFWATWCGPCRSEMPYLQQIYEEWQDRGLVILTINLRQSASEVRQFMQENGLSFPVLLDTSGDVTEKYNVVGIPTTFFLDKDGVIKEKRVGSFSSKQQIEDYLGLIIPR